ncbi:VOC family protein [Croceicoccus hydrothermalis]|uniref:VOC family protein n=1 Tax=Croceicoccus hydrothermalis TaxID=2867964 RepID=UPI001EFB9E8B|nr:VOC family protein [Croceicoccus hydrothermalis]
MTQFVSPDTLRARFSAAMSAMYRDEVPLYGELLDIVASVNARSGGAAPRDGGRLGEERHGAIRVGTAAELRAMRRFFAVMGMEPVDYYDLSVAGVPVHSTAFRPITAKGMEANPFRMFCSLLRLELIEDAGLRERAADILETRQICSSRLMELIAKAEEEGGLNHADAEAFLGEGLNVFRWHHAARVDARTYAQLHDAHRLIADVVSFQGPHINHLTPRTLDIDAAQSDMIAHNIDAKEQIEGPPRRACPILLRQTSFKALSETVSFGGDDAGAHTARFGEIEQRGAALTPKGRALYDRCLADARAAGGDYDAALRESFARFPDDLDAMRDEALAFFHGGQPITYEDFLPVSAAGIFQSNLGADTGNGAVTGGSAQDAFEDALGLAVHNPFALYRAASDDDAG